MSTPTTAYRLAALTLGLATSPHVTTEEAERRLADVADAATVPTARSVLERLSHTDAAAARRALRLLDRVGPSLDRSAARSEGAGGHVALSR